MDITDSDEFISFLNKEYVDLIVNAAAGIHGSPAEQRRINTFAAKSIANEAANRKIPFFHISSASIYGKGEVKDAREDAPMMPYSPYTISKAEADERMMELARTKDAPIAVLVLPVVYGRARKIQGFNRLLWAIKHRLLPISPTRPLSKRVAHSYLDAMVTVPAAIEFLFNYKGDGKVYGEKFNVANPKPVPYIELLEGIKKEMRRHMPFKIYLPLVVVGPLVYVSVRIIRFLNMFLPEHRKITIDNELNYIYSLYYNFTINTDKLTALGFNPDAQTFFTSLSDLVGHFHEAITSPEPHHFQAKVNPGKVDKGAEVKELTDVISVRSDGELIFGTQFSEFCGKLGIDPKEAERVLMLAFGLRKKDIKGAITGLVFNLSARYDYLFGDHEMNSIVLLNDSALGELPMPIRLLTLALGLSHEILGHEQGMHDEDKLTEKDVIMTHTLLLLLNLDISAYLDALDKILVKEESPYIIELHKQLPNIKNLPLSVVYFYILFAEKIIAEAGTNIGPDMDLEEGILIKVKTNLGLKLTEDEDRYLKGLIGLLWRNRNTLRSMAGMRGEFLNGEIRKIQERLNFVSDDPVSIREEIERSIKASLEEIKPQRYSKQEPGILIFDIDKIDESIDILENIAGQTGNYKVVLVNHDTGEPLSEKLKTIRREQRRLYDRLKTLMSKGITVDAYNLRTLRGTDIGKAIVLKAKQETAKKLNVGIDQILDRNITLGIQPANLYLYPADILKGITVLILSSKSLVLTEGQIQALERIYPDIRSHLEGGQRLLLLEEVY